MLLLKCIILNLKGRKTKLKTFLARDALLERSLTKLPFYVSLCELKICNKIKNIRKTIPERFGVFSLHFLTLTAISRDHCR